MNLWTPKGRRIVKPSVAECRVFGHGLAIGMGARLSPAYSPATIATILAWYRGDLEAAATGWGDQSGTGDANKDAAQASAPLRPSLAAEAAFDGQPAFTFSGSKLFKTGTWASPVAQPFTIILAVQWTSSASNEYAIDNLTDPSQCGIINSTGTISAFTGFHAPITTPEDPLVAQIIAVEFNGASSKIFRSSTTATGSGNLGSGGLTGLTIGNYAGGGAFAASKIAEIVAFGGVSDTVRNTCVAYMGARYAIAIA